MLHAVLLALEGTQWEAGAASSSRRLLLCLSAALAVERLETCVAQIPQVEQGGTRSNPVGHSKVSGCSLGDAAHCVGARCNDSRPGHSASGGEGPDEGKDGLCVQVEAEVVSLGDMRGRGNIGEALSQVSANLCTVWEI